MVADGDGSHSSGSPPFSGYGTERQRPGSADPSLADIGYYISVARASAMTYMALQMTRVKIIVRNAILFSVVVVCAALVAITVVVYATVMVCAGVAGAIAELCGGRLWLGHLITGTLVLGTVVLFALVMVRRVLRGGRKATIAQFEREKLRAQHTTTPM